VAGGGETTTVATSLMVAATETARTILAGQTAGADPVTGTTTASDAA